METERRRRRDEASSVPIAVREAIQAFGPDAGTKVLPVRPSEISFVYDWGVRVVSTSDESATAVWMYLVSKICRTQRTKMWMSGGKTSKATQHLNKAHGIGSDKTASEVGKKRTREEQLAVLRRSPLHRDGPGRAYVLIETLRIVNNSLPFRIGEYAESLLLRDLMLKEEVRVALNAKVIRHAVVELYDATKRQVEVMLANNRIGAAKSFSIVADFWSAPTMNTKFLGLRLYLVDSSFQFKSVLLGTRHFAPQYGERGGGIRGPFFRWIGDVFADFGLSRHDLFGSTSDGGSDVRWMMTTGLALSWEWCVPHFMHAATKTEFGIVADSNRSKNPAMTDLLRRVVKTVYQTQHVEVMGTLFSELCSLMTDDDVNARQLLNFRIHRFLGLARVVRRILLLWDPLVAWYEERIARAQRDNGVPPSAFPLAQDKMDLIQVLSLLEPIATVCRNGQYESGNQCNVLLGLFKLRISVLDVSTALKDCRSTKTDRQFFRPEELSNLASTTRSLLQKAFHRVYFRQYTDRDVMNTCVYAFEMQLLLRPNFKNPDGALKKVIQRTNLQASASQQVADRHYTKVRCKVIDGVRKIMEAVDTQPTSPGVDAPSPNVVFSEDVM